MIVDNEHDPEQDPEYISPEERRQFQLFTLVVVSITAAWISFLGWLFYQTGGSL